MIKNIADYFKEQIGWSKEIRELSYDLFRHRITAKNSTIQNIMVSDVVDICMEVNRKSNAILLEPDEEAIKRMIQGKFYGQFKRIPKHYSGFLNGGGFPHARVSMSKEKFIKGENWAFEASAVQVSLMVAQGMINMSKSYEAKARTGHFNIVLASFRQCYRYLLSEIRKEIYQKAHKVAEELARGGIEVQVDTAGVSYISSEYMLIKGHGLTSGGGTKPDERVKGHQTTTGVMDQIDKFLKESKRLEEDYKNPDTIGLKLDRAVFEETLEIYRDVLEKHFSLSKFADPTTLKWNEDLVIQLEIISRAPVAPGGTMQQRTMDGFDYREVSRKLAWEVEKAIAKNMSPLLKAWALMSGSPSRADMMSQIQMNRLFDEISKGVKSKKGGKKGGVDFRLKVNKQLSKKVPKSKSGVASFSVGKLQKKIKAVAASQVKAKKFKGRAVAGQGKTGPSPIALRNILNEALPQMVASKMSEPALVFRTGRFANSARVDMIHQGPKGGIGVDYTYLKEPYQTFEPGFKQGSTQRDPRKIIGESIRELATTILGRQPHTIRRV